MVLTEIGTEEFNVFSNEIAGLSRPIIISMNGTDPNEWSDTRRSTAYFVVMGVGATMLLSIILA